LTRGRLLVGTSGFAYPAWSPRFYPSGVKGDGLLSFYAGRLPAVELNNTFYARPTAARIAGWVAATPPDFRFIVKAQRGAAIRALTATPEESVRWLTEDLGGFGERLGAVLLRVPHNVHRKPEAGSGVALRRLLSAWPAAIPLVAEFQHDSWHVDETYSALHEAKVTLCATDLPENGDAPTIRMTGRLVYLRLRRHGYDPDELRRWAGRIEPFLAAGHDAYVFFRHDETGRGPELAVQLIEAVNAG